MYVYWYGDVHSLDIGGVVDSSGEFDVLQAGTTVGQASNFSAASLKMENWTSVASGYLGIAFENADTGILNYGWIEMTTSSPGGYPASWGDYCYDQTGADIIIDGEPVVTYAVTPSVGTPAGSISPNTPQNVTENSTTNFTLAPEYGYMVDDVTGSCGGTLSGNSFTTDPITADCSVVVNFKEDPNSASVLYDQTGNTTNTGSVAFLDLDDPVGYETQAADDFIVPAGEEWTVEEFYINGFHHPDYPGTPTTSANVFIYQDDNGSPGSEVDAFLQMSPQDNDGELTLTLPGSGVVLQPGIYWVSVQPERDWFGEGPWYWLQEDSSNGAIFHWRNPGDGFGNGCIDWGPGDLCVDSENDDLSFQIRGHKDDLEADTWTVSPGVGSGQGSISPSSDQTVDEGDTITFTLTPDTGYEIDGVTGSCGGTLSGNAFTTDPVTADCDVVAHFAEEPVPEWTVSPSVGSGQGSISPDTEQTVDEGDTITFTLTPDTGYEIDEVTGSCGGTLDGNEFVTDPVTADCDVIAHFAEEPVPTWTVSPGVGSGQGSISPDTDQTVDEGETATFTLIPDTGYEIDVVTGSCGGTLDGHESVTDPVPADCDIIANFIDEYEVTWTVSASVGTGKGRVSPVHQTVYVGETATLILTADTGYYIDDITGSCGGTRSGNIFVTDPVTADCTVVAHFAEGEEPEDEIFQDRFEQPAP